MKGVEWGWLAGTCAVMVVALLPGFPLADEEESAHDAGHLRGIVTEINYRRGSLELRSVQNQRFLLHVMPSTTISTADHDADDYHAITDIHTGSHIEADVSRRGKRYEAQTIELESR